MFTVFGLVLAVNLTRYQKQLKARRQSAPPVAVTVAKATQETWQPTLKAVGSLTAVQGVNVAPQVRGKVVGIYFNDGQEVVTGDLLVKLEDKEEQAALKKAQAEAQLAQIAITRYTPLLKQGGISPFKMDQLRAQLKEAKAQVAEAQARLDHLHIRAPFVGRLGIRQIDLGEMISPGKTLVRLDSQGTLYADFSLSEQYLNKVYVGQPVTVVSDTLSGESFSGEILAISAQVDPNTRSFQLRAEVPNQDNKLTPGSFAELSVHLKAENNVVSVPKTAVSYSLFGDTVYVVEGLKELNKKASGKKGKVYKVKRVSVKPGMEQDPNIAITQGLEGGEFVVSSGQLKLENGSRVTLEDTQQKATLTPPATIPLQ